MEESSRNDAPAFEYLEFFGVDQDWLGTHEDHIKTAEKLGFKHEGTLRDSEWLHDRFINQELYSRLAIGH